MMVLLLTQSKLICLIVFFMLLQVLVLTKFSLQQQARMHCYIDNYYQGWQRKDVPPSTVPIAPIVLSSAPGTVSVNNLNLNNFLPQAVVKLVKTTFLLVLYDFTLKVRLRIYG